MQQEPKQFADRQTLMAHVKNLSPSLADRGDAAASPIIGGRKAGEAALAQIDPIAYGDSRNFLDGAVTRLSPYIRHGILSLNEVRNHALDRGDGKAIEKFIQELGWRDFWQRIYAQNPDWLWRDIEDYKTGFVASDYADELPDDIANGETESAAMNHFIDELKSTGYLHNHARMYLAAYIVHWRRVKWQAGAVFFLQHLLDGDPLPIIYPFNGWPAHLPISRIFSISTICRNSPACKRHAIIMPINVLAALMMIWRCACFPIWRPCDEQADLAARRLFARHA